MTGDDATRRLFERARVRAEAVARAPVGLVGVANTARGGVATFKTLKGRTVRVFLRDLPPEPAAGPKLPDPGKAEILFSLPELTDQEKAEMLHPDAKRN